MTPYVDLRYFLFLLYPLVLLPALGLLRWMRAWTILLVSLGVIAFQYADPFGTAAEQAAGLRQLALLAGYAVASVFVVLEYAVLPSRRHSQAAFYGAVALALAPLVIVKVYPLTLPQAAGPESALSTVGVYDTLGFLGISYMTFRLLDVIISLHDGTVNEPPTPVGLLAYLLFVPTISAGPIDRYRRFLGDLSRPARSRSEYLLDVEAGISRIARGLLYKFILAYLVYTYALQPAAAAPGPLGTLRYMYAYSLYIFFDFAGYSAFAIGFGRFFGIRVPENFDRPFLSRSFKEMWDRWHISLSWWMRDHVYMRFMLTAMRHRWFGGDRIRASQAGILLTMTLMGMWHGLAPHYIAYGVYQGAMLVLYDVVGRWNRGHRLVADSRYSRAASVFVTVNLFCFGLLIFSGHLFR